MWSSPILRSSRYIRPNGSKPKSSSTPATRPKTSSHESSGLCVTDQRTNCRPVTVSAVMPNARGSASSTPRTIPLRIKTTEPMTQRSSAVIWTRVREFRRRKLYAYYRLIYDGSKDVSSAWCDWALVAFSDAQGIAANDAWRHCVQKASTELLAATVKIRPESRKCMISKRIPVFLVPPTREGPDLTRARHSRSVLRPTRSNVPIRGGR
jgi:hypothetical protein